MDEYKLHTATRAIIEFILDDLSRWYIQLIRPRTWTEADDPDKLAVYRVLYDVFTTVTRVIAPFMPYLAEKIYQNLEDGGAGEDGANGSSVHACDWPVPNQDLIDLQLEEDMAEIRKVVEAAANARQKAKRKLRWPVARIVVAPAGEAGKDVMRAVRSLAGVLSEQANAKEIVVLGVDEAWDALGVEATPDMAKLGPAFKKDAGKVADAIRGADASALMAAIENTGECELDYATIATDMVSFRRTLPEYAVDSEFVHGMVYVDVSLTPEIEAEGYSAEVIRRIQDMRKELDLEVNDWIRVAVTLSDERVGDLLHKMEEVIAGEVRAKEMSIGDASATGDLVKEWTVEGVEISIGVGRMKP